MKKKKKTNWMPFVAIAAIAVAILTTKNTGSLAYHGAGTNFQSMRMYNNASGQSRPISIRGDTQNFTLG
jgi:hypothetical protein